MSVTDCSTNRFNNFDDSQTKNPFISKNTEPTTPPVSSRWSNLSSPDDDPVDSYRGDRGDSYRGDSYRGDRGDSYRGDSDRGHRGHRGDRGDSYRGDSDRGYRGDSYRGDGSPRNTFRKDKSNFGPDKDKYGNYRKPTFRRTTRPKTPPPKIFDYKDDDFPTLG